MSLVLKKASGTQASDDAPDVAETVATVIEAVRTRGDEAVRELAERFDGWSRPPRLDSDVVEAVIATLPAQVIDDIVTVQSNVREFALRQRETLVDLDIEIQPGVHLGHRHIPIEAVGAYVPGGRFPLTASAHMTIVTAKAAGVSRVMACTPPIRGEIPAATVAAMHLAGADEIYILGGIQAIAAMAVGTETIRPVNLIAGPGNSFVAEAKRQLFGEVGIDLPAGPTETLVIADETADPFVVAVDLLSQAEHGPDSPAILITTCERVGREALAHIERLLPGMPTRDFAEPAWRNHGEAHLVATLDEACSLADAFASEHVQVLTAQPRDALERLRNYGALFLGEGTCVSFGDKVIGTNHVLPTRGAARFTGGLWVGKYLKTCTHQEVVDERASAELGRLCGRAARVELFEGHARSGDVRAAKYLGDPLPWNVLGGSNP